MWMDSAHIHIPFHAPNTSSTNEQTTSSANPSSWWVGQNRISLVCDQAWFDTWVANKDNYYPLEKQNDETETPQIPSSLFDAVVAYAQLRQAAYVFGHSLSAGSLACAAMDLALALESLNFDWHLASGVVVPTHLVNKSIFACKKSSMSFSKVLNFLISCTSHPCGDNMVWIPANPKMLLVLKLDGVIKIRPCYQLENMTGYSSDVV